MRAKAKEMATKMRIARYSISMNSPLSGREHIFNLGWDVDSQLA
jgi:hypothetical protein